MQVQSKIAQNMQDVNLFGQDLQAPIIFLAYTSLVLPPNKRMLLMTIGMPKEVKEHEYRVCLLPAAMRELVKRSHSVIVQTAAGEGIGIDDAYYANAGATIMDSAQSIFCKAELIIKVKEPQPHEFALLREGQLLFCFLHLAANRPLTSTLLERRVTAIAFETVKDDLGRLPLLVPMSQAAGTLATQVAARCLEKQNGGPGLLLSGLPGVPPARIVILGGGVAGTESARMAVALGADVTIFDNRSDRLAELDQSFNGRLRTRYADADSLAEELTRTDVLICAVLVPGASAPRLVTRALISRMHKGAIIIDLAIDQGGCCEHRDLLRMPLRHMSRNG